MTHDPKTTDAVHLSEEALVLHYYSEETPQERASAVRHLAACEPCRAELARLSQVLGLVSAHDYEPAPEGFERVMWARVEQKLSESRRAGWRTWFAPRRLALAGAAAAIVLAAFVAGRWSGAPAVQVPGTTETVASGVPERVLLVAVGDHLERSQMVIVELLNQDPGTLILPTGERDRAADLVADNRLFRQSADEAGEAALSGVLDDLERVLIEIANGGDETTAEELQRLRTRIESRGILFRMRVMTSEMRDRQERRRVPDVPAT
jgi:hypothetical protein